MRNFDRVKSGVPGIHDGNPLKISLCFENREVNPALKRDEPAPNKEGVKFSEGQFSDLRIRVPKALESAQKPSPGQRNHRARIHQIEAKKHRPSFVQIHLNSRSPISPTNPSTPTNKATTPQPPTASR